MCAGSPSQPCLHAAACFPSTGYSSPGIPRCCRAGEPLGAMSRQPPTPHHTTAVSRVLGEVVLGIWLRVEEKRLVLYCS